MAKDKDKKEKKGFLGRFFGGKKDEGGAPQTPSGDSAEDAATIPPGSPATPAADFSPDGATIESNEIGNDAATIPPGYIKGPPRSEKGKKGAPRTPPAAQADEGMGEMTMAPAYAKGRPPATPQGGGDLDRTMPPGYVMGGAKGSPATPGVTDIDLTMPPGYAGGGGDMGEMTMAPAYAKPRGPGGGKPPANDLDMMTMPPGYALGGGPASEMTMPPGYARAGGLGADLGDDPFARQGGPVDQDLVLTNDPDLQPAPRTAAADPFGFGPGDDIMGGPGAPPAAPRPAKRKPSDTFGFGEDVVDLLAPGPGGTASGAGGPAGAAADPFGAPLTDDPYEGGTAPPPPPAQAPARPAGHKTEPLAAASGIGLFDVELDSPAPAAPAADGEISQEEVTLEMDRPAAAAGPKGFQARATNRLGAGSALSEDGVSPSQPPRRAATTEPTLEAVPAAPAARTLWGTSEVTPEGGKRLGGKAAEVVLDAASRVFHAPAVPGGWSDVPAFAAVLADGSVVGRLPRTAQVEADGSVVLAASPPRRAWEPDPSGSGRRASPFPAGVVLERETRIAYASPEVAPHVEGSPEPRIRTEDGGLVFFVPAGATFDDAGGYSLPDEAPKAATAARAAEPAVSLGPAHAAHGELVLRSSYLGCEELVYADGWGSVQLPAGAKLERDFVLLPPASRSAAGAPPELLDVVHRADGWIQLPIPEGFLPEGDLVWIAPVAASEAEPESDPSWTEAWGEPVERLTYAGIEDSLHANGWIRLDLPPGASVTGQRVRIPREYAHAANAATLAGFEREPDGTLSCDLPADAEVLGSVVLLPPAGETSAPPPPAPSGITRAKASTGGPSTPADEPGSASSSAAFRSAAPPDGGDVARPGATRSLDRFRAKKAAAEPEARKDEPAAAASEESRADRADAPSADKPKADPSRADEPKADGGASPGVSDDAGKPEAGASASSPELAPSASTADGTAADKPASETAADKPDGADAPDEAPDAPVEADSADGGGQIRRGKKRKKN